MILPVFGSRMPTAFAVDTVQRGSGVSREEHDRACGGGDQKPGDPDRD